MKLSDLLQESPIVHVLRQAAMALAHIAPSKFKSGHGLQPNFISNKNDVELRVFLDTNGKPTVRLQYPRESKGYEVGRELMKKVQQAILDRTVSSVHGGTTDDLFSTWELKV